MKIDLLLLSILTVGVAACSDDDHHAVTLGTDGAVQETQADATGRADTRSPTDSSINDSSSARPDGTADGHIDGGSSDTLLTADTWRADGADDAIMADSPTGDTNVVDVYDAYADADAGCSCGPAAGCLTVTVRRVPVGSDSLLAWNRGYTVSTPDGVGRLVVSGVQASSVVVQKTRDNADMRPAAASYDLDLGCLPTGEYRAYAFLSDHPEREDAAVYSAISRNFYDTCAAYDYTAGRPGFTPATIEAGKRTSAVVTLAESCDS